MASSPSPQPWTPGPWRWEVNRKSREIKLCGGRPRFDLTVMDFVRWGMAGAAVRFRRKGDSFDVMEHATRFAVPLAGREHHESWFRVLDHPDARLMEAAPDLYDALKRVLGNIDHGNADTHEEGCRCFIHEGLAALRKAEGKTNG